MQQYTKEQSYMTSRSAALLFADSLFEERFSDIFSKLHSLAYSMALRLGPAGRDVIPGMVMEAAKVLIAEKAEKAEQREKSLRNSSNDQHRATMIRLIQRNIKDIRAARKEIIAHGLDRDDRFGIEYTMDNYATLIEWYLDAAEEGSSMRDVITVYHESDTVRYNMRSILNEFLAADFGREEARHEREIELATRVAELCGWTSIRTLA